MSQQWKRFFRGIVVLLIVLLAGSACSAAQTDEEPVALLVFDRPPYYVLKEGQPAGGFLLDIALAVFSQAGIPVRAQEVPPGRILATFMARDLRACAVGWLRTPEREAYVRFSLPLYEDKPLGVVVTPEKAREFGSAPTLDTLLAAGLTWGLRRGFSYGQTLDAAFKKYPGQATRLCSDTRRMVRLIAKHRLDAALIAPEELSSVLEAEPDLAEEIRFLPIVDAPSGFDRHRHIICDDSLPPALLDRIDAAIKAFRQSERYRSLTRLRTGH